MRDATPPPSWIPADAPPIDQLTGPADREVIAEWSRGFSVVRQIAPISDTLLVVQYGSHDPKDTDRYFVEPRSVDVYAINGEKLAEGIRLPDPIVGGGQELLVLTAEPPSPWTITLYRWRGR